MNCNNCGKQINEGGKFCTGCGAGIQMDSSVAEPRPQNQMNQQPMINQNLNAEPIANDIGIPTISSQIPQEAINQAVLNQEPVSQVPINNKDKKGLFSLLAGIGAIVLSAFIYLAVPLGIAGIYFKSKEEPKSGKGKAGKILSIIGLVLSCLAFIGGYVLKGFSQTYSGDGFELKYNYNWRVGNLQGGQEALINDANNSYLIPIGSSSLSQHSSYNFDTDAGKKSIYDEFYRMWQSSMSSQSMTLASGSEGFGVLKGNIYYATIDYGKSTDNLNGRYYILISKEDNIVLSFMTNSKPENFNKNNSETLKMLKGIKITNGSIGNNNSNNKDDNNSNNNLGTFTPGTTKDYMALGYMDYKIPDCWAYSEEMSAAQQYKSYVFTFKDGKSFAEAKANTPMNSTTFEVGTSIERMRDNIRNAGLTIKSETTRTFNGKSWHHIITEDYDNANLAGNLHSEYFITFSTNNRNLYMFEFYLANVYSSSDKKYIDDSIDYILNSTKLLKVED